MVLRRALRGAREVEMEVAALCTSSEVQVAPRGTGTEQG